MSNFLNKKLLLLSKSPQEQKIDEPNNKKKGFKQNYKKFKNFHKVSKSKYN